MLAIIDIDLLICSKLDIKHISKLMTVSKTIYDNLSKYISIEKSSRTHSRSKTTIKTYKIHCLDIVENYITTEYNSVQHHSFVNDFGYAIVFLDNMLIDVVYMDKYCRTRGLIWYLSETQGLSFPVFQQIIGYVLGKYIDIFELIDICANTSHRTQSNLLSYDLSCEVSTYMREKYYGIPPLEACTSPAVGEYMRQL